MHSSVRRTAHRIESFVSGHLLQPWRSHRRFEEQHLGRLLDYLEVDCVLDVGANIGQYAMMLREYCGYRGRIVSFEPTPEPLARLRDHSRPDSLWAVEGIALGDSNGQATFLTLPTASEGNSFLPLRERQSPQDQQVEVRVEVRRLDNLLPELQKKFGFTRPFLKMDTQGFDLQVFAGAGNILPSVVGLQSELSINPFYAGAPGWLESLSVYQQAGFVLSALVPNNTDWFPQLREIDCIMYRPGSVPNGQP